jgi:hypothetical protein
MDFSTFAGAALTLAFATTNPVHAADGIHAYQGAYGPPAHIAQITYGYSRIPLQRIIRKLHNKGFYNLKSMKSLAHTYQIKIHGPRGKLVLVKANAYNGDIISIDRMHSQANYKHTKKRYNGHKNYQANYKHTNKRYNGHKNYNGYYDRHQWNSNPSHRYHYRGAHNGFRLGVWGSTNH